MHNCYAHLFLGMRQYTKSEAAFIAVRMLHADKTVLS